MSIITLISITTQRASLSLSLSPLETHSYTQKEEEEEEDVDYLPLPLWGGLFRRGNKKFRFFFPLSLSLNGDVVGVKRRGREREASSSIDGVL